jgi:hypothetical protein
MKYIQNKDIITAEIDEEIVMLDIEQGKYFALNPVAKTIWELLSEEKDTKQLVDELLVIYEVDLETCLLDTAEHLTELVKLKIIKPI